MPDSYRTQEEKNAWMEEDSIVAYRIKLIAAGVASQADFDAIDATIIETVTNVVQMAADPVRPPRMDLFKTNLYMKPYSCKNFWL